jgi:hypothetical protein
MSTKKTTRPNLKSPPKKKSLLGKNLPDTPEPFYLVCHGMMMFFWDYQNDPDHISILIRDIPMMFNGHPQHEVLLSSHRGAIDSGGGRVDFMVGEKGDYELSLTTEIRRPKAAYVPDATKDVVLDSRKRKSKVPERSQHLSVKRSKLDYVIRVPYPSSVLRARIAKRPNSKRVGPLILGSVADEYKVNPSEVAGAHIFVYEGVKTARLQGPQIDVDLDAEGIRKLFLYSEENDPSTSPTPPHLQEFNKMASFPAFSKNSLAPWDTQLDLKGGTGNDGVSLTGATYHKYGAFTKDTLPAGLELGDLCPLADYHLGAYTPVDPGTLKQAAPIVDGKQAHATDPIECLQGWGT